MNLTNEQKQNLEKGDPIAIHIDRMECVVIRKDIYEQERLAQYGELTEEQRQHLFQQAAERGLG